MILCASAAASFAARPAAGGRRVLVASVRLGPHDGKRSPGMRGPVPASPSAAAYHVRVVLVILETALAFVVTRMVGW